MDDSNGNPSPCGTQIDHLPSCLIMDILLRLPNRSLLSCRVVCRSWNLVFSDPLFVKLHLARSPTYLIPLPIGIKPMKFYSRYCRNLVAGISGESPESEANRRVHHSDLTWVNSSSNGLLCLENWKSGDEIYVCNPVLGQYITIPTGKGRVQSVLGFSSRSNQFKVLQITSPKYSSALARIYTIGDGTRQWKSIGVAPSRPHFRRGCFLNGSIHWAVQETGQIFYFNFDSEQFGLLPSPPVGRDCEQFVTMGVLDGWLFCYAGIKTQEMQLWNSGFWIMKEYGVEESWTKIFSIDDTEPNQVFSSLHKKLSLLYENCKIQLGGHGTAYTPSFISLQDAAKGEQLSVIS